jgi:hypothetical protein
MRKIHAEREAEMKTTAANFKKNPQKHYRAADLGETVTINHDRYPDKIFEMIARDRNPLNQKIENTSTCKKDNEIRRDHVLNELASLSQDDGMGY